VALVGRSRFRNCAAALVLVAVMASCSAAATSRPASSSLSANLPSPIAGSFASAATETAPSSAAPTDTAGPATNPTPAPTLDTTDQIDLSDATDLPAPTPAGTARPVAPLPAGNWTSIHWTKVAGQDGVWADPPDELPNGVDEDSGWTMYGWSQGYLAFDQLETDNDDGSWRLVTKTRISSDGVHWQAGGEFTQKGGANDDLPEMQDGIGGVVEGPAGLLAMGAAHADCGSNTYAWPEAVSADGRNWKTVYTDAYGASVDGGASGYITAGPDGIWTSTDGLTWKATDLKSAAFAGYKGIEGGTSVAGGFVVSGETTFPDKSCGNSDTPALMPTLWSSPDGATWTKDTLPDATPRGNLSLFVCRFNDHLLLASEVGGAANANWMSTDGVTWTAAPATPVTLCPYVAKYSENVVLSLGTRTLVLSNSDPKKIWLLRDDLTLVAISQTGTLPSGGNFGALFGPAGLIVAGDDGNTYVGVPVAG
jgi:hypothetical protein